MDELRRTVQMLRKIGMTAVAVAIGFGGIAAFAGPASAGKPVLGNATGNVTCPVTGKVKIVPPLTNVNTQPSTTTAKTKAPAPCTASGGTIGAYGITKAKGLVTSTGTEPGTCSGVLEPGSTPFNATITWKSGGAKLNPSTVTFANVGPAGDGFDLPSNGAAGKGTSTVNGSFAGDTAWSHASVDLAQVASQLATCDPNEKGKVKGIKKITITGGHITLEQ
jgi:hypothetical protein